MIARGALSLASVSLVALAACGNPPPPEPTTSSSAATAQSSSAACATLGGISGQLDDRGTQAASGSSLDVTAGDSYFSPTCLTGVSAGTVTLTVTNKGSALHNVSVTAQGIDMDVPAGQTVTVKVSLAASAPLTYFCKYHRGSGMQGALLPSA